MTIPYNPVPVLDKPKTKTITLLTLRSFHKHPSNPQLSRSNNNPIWVSNRCLLHAWRYGLVPPPAQKQRHPRTQLRKHNNIPITTVPQFYFIGIAFHIMSEFRMPIYWNLSFAILLFVAMWLSYWIILLPMSWMRYWLQLRRLRMYYKVMVAGITIAGGILSILWEVLINWIFGKSEILIRRPLMELKIDN